MPSTWGSARSASYPWWTRAMPTSPATVRPFSRSRLASATTSPFVAACIAGTAVAPPGTIHELCDISLDTGYPVASQGTARDRTAGRHHDNPGLQRHHVEGHAVLRFGLIGDVKEPDHMPPEHLPHPVGGL